MGQLGITCLTIVFDEPVGHGKERLIFEIGLLTG